MTLNFFVIRFIRWYITAETLISCDWSGFLLAWSVMQQRVFEINYKCNRHFLGIFRTFHCPIRFMHFSCNSVLIGNSCIFSFSFFLFLCLSNFLIWCQSAIYMPHKVKVFRHFFLENKIVKSRASGFQTYLKDEEGLQQVTTCQKSTECFRCHI